MKISSPNYHPIIKNIYDELKTCKLPDNIGLHAGTSGIALFLAYYERVIYRRNEISGRVMDILEHNVECINSGICLHSICGGMSGFGWLCEHLRELGMFNREMIEFLDDLDIYLCKQMIIDIKRGNYDFLHGALGVGTYLLSRLDKKEVPQYLDELLTELEDTGISCENNGIKWLSVLDPKKDEKGYNISLSHGMSSIAAFLIRLHHLNFEIERVEKLLTQTVAYILAQRTMNQGQISYFPTYSKESSIENNMSRLGWCYGDLGIAYILRRAALVLRHEELEKTALLILNNTGKRRDLNSNSIRDAGFCHGSAGISHMYRNLYQTTKNIEFVKTADYWLNITIQMAKYTDGAAGYKAWRTAEYGGPVKTYSLLEGIAGIGLVFLSIKEKEITWDESLMLS